MSRVNVWAVVVAAVAAFVASSVWYAVFGKQLAHASAAFAAQRPAPWKLLVVVAQSFVLSLVLAYLLGLIGPVSAVRAAGIGVLLWLGLSVVQWVGSMLWEQVPLAMAAIHAGDWLVKLVLVCLIVGVWRR
jgi:hypothetical protein